MEARHSPQNKGAQAQPVQVYVTATCPYCTAAKALLDRKAVAYEVIDVSTDTAKRQWLAEVSGQRTVPQIFIGGRPIGGYSELSALEQAGQLDARLSSDGAASG